MEKKEAEIFVIKRLDLGLKVEEIADELSLRLGAPQELLLKFVNQVAEPYIQSQKPNFDSHPIPNEQEKIEGQPSLDKYTLEQDTLLDNALSKDEITQDDRESLPASQTITYQSEPAEEDSEYHFEQETEGYAKNLDVDLIELKEEILHDLKIQKRYSDIVQKVCESTGWSWDEAQRYVARTQTKNHHKINLSQRTFMIPFSVIFIIGGLLLLIWSIMTFMDYQSAMTGQGNSTLSTDFIPLLLGGFFASFGIIAGGIYGLYRSLTNQ